MGKLSDVTIRGWIRSGERFEGRSDGEGLVLAWRRDTNSPTWKFRYRFAGKPRVMNLGSYSDLTLSIARQAAKELRAKVTLGHDVAGEKQERKTEALAKIEAARNCMTVSKLADEYFERMVLGKWKHPHLPGERTKTGQPLDIPLPTMGVQRLQELRRLALGSEWVLPARKMQSRMLPHICESTIGVAMGKIKHGLPHFTTHDFRRTARTHLAALGIDPQVAERCLNHKLKGVEGVYNRHDYFAERKLALQAWGQRLACLDQGEPKA